jgi:cell division septum initiation protein DivIVA
MDRGEHLKQDRSNAGAFDGVAAGASARVGEILREAERHARDCDAEAERAALSTESAARADAERLFEDARAEALRVARERADHIAAIQAKLRTRGPAVLEGLEGSGATRARIEALIEALAASAGEVLAEAEAELPTELGDIDPDIRGKDGPAADEPEEEAAAEPAGAAADAPAVGPEAEPDEGADGAPEGPRPIASLEHAAAAPNGDAVSSRVETAAPNGEAVASMVETALPNGAASANRDVNGAGSTGPLRYDGPLPEGAPLARRPRRSKERDARFNALLLALQGHDRAEVEERLCEDYDPDDCARILDEVFGRPADTPA